MSNEKKVTTGELKMIRMIAESDFRDAEQDLGDPVWSPAVTPEQKGWLSSCVKKGYAVVDNAHKKGEETAWLTDEGILIYADNK